MRLEPGSRLGPYEITGTVGAGGMGEVYRARDTRLGREVAVKVLPHHFTRDPERLARFEREARSASALNHRNIITIHDFTLNEGEAWLVMELIRGESLRDLVSRGALPLKKMLPIAVGVAEGLAAAHAAGIVHRDLKPENIMITAEGIPKILDFGLVKSITSIDADSPTELQVSKSGVVMGTATYMSPEQARGEPLDFRTDHFSFGLILQEMVTGRHPFPRRTGVEVLAAILNDEADPLSPELPESFVAIVERCLAKDPKHRYGSTVDLAHDLARIGTTRVGPASRKSLNPWWAIVPALLIAAAASFFALRPRAQPQATGNPMELSIAIPGVSSIHLGEVAMPISLSPNGAYLLAYGEGVNGSNGLWLHDMRSGTSRFLAEQGWLPAWAPDSSAIAYFAEGKLKTIAVVGGPPHTVCDALSEGTPSWNGETILFAQYSKNPGIYRVSSRGGTPEPMIKASFKNGSSLPWWPSFLPDGKRFLYLTMTHTESGEFGHELRLASLDGNDTAVAANIDSRAVFSDGYLLFVRDGTLVAQPFDIDSARLSGAARPLLDDIHYFRNTGLAAFSVSQTGALAWRAAQPPSRLAWVDRSGIEAATIGTARFAGEGRLSRDGTRYAVGVIDPKQGVSDLWVYDLTRESPERLTFHWMDEKAPVWGPQGQIYFRTDGLGGAPDIARHRPGVQQPEAVHRGPGVEEPKDVSSDGRWLLFIDYFASGTDVSVLPLDPPGPPRRYLHSPFNESSPRFSPDVKWVAYASDVSGQQEVYVRPFEGEAQATRISRSGGTKPAWRGDGREFYFLDPRGRLMAVPFENGIPGAPRTLFQAVDAVGFEPDATGAKFLMQLEQRTGPSLRILTDWKARLGK